MTDTFEHHGSGLTAPITHAVAVTPSDLADLAVVPRALFLGGAGDLTVTLKDDAAAVTLTGAAAGWHPIRARRVWATGTTATTIVAGW